MLIDGSGNVGIGTSSPTAVAANYTTLHLDGSSGSGIHLTKTTSGTTATDGSHLFNAGGDFYLYHYESGNIVFSSGTPATERMRIDSAGRVGIGTQSPEALLDVAYNLPDDTNGIIRPLKVRTTDTLNETNLLSGDGVGILFEIPDQTSSSIGASIDAVKEGGADDDISTVLSFKTSANNETLNEAMRIDSAGRVTKPSQPAFTAQPTSFTGSGGIAGTPTFIFATALLNIGGHFNTSNGRFTAPVAGNYFFTYSITAASSSKNARYLRVRLAKNGTTVLNPHNTVSDETGDADYNLISASGLVAMNASDYVELNYGSSIDASGLVFYNNMNTFSGFLMS